MIDSVLGIYTTLGSITNLDLSQWIDIRSNHVEESAIVGRLVALPTISNISVEGNLFTEIEDEYRARCFEYFLKDGKNVTLDGTPPSFYDRRSITVSAPEPPPIEPAPAPSPNAVAVAAPRPPSVPRANPSPKITPALECGADAERFIVFAFQLAEHPAKALHQRHVLPSPIREETEPVVSPTPSTRPSGHRRQTSGSSLGGMGKGSKGAKRRARTLASVYEPAGNGGESNAVDDGEAFRRKMEALRA
ncbi:hypothetical protein FRC07_002851 [Ceratobasidium sp. 392]|nr:hypothetical protein FRC07_002851 [Ceratobasidium sp. 392]